MLSSTSGSLTRIGWKRRSRAASFSTCLRYSSSVVAPMQRNSPRASAGLMRLPAEMAPSAAPAPPTAVRDLTPPAFGRVYTEVLDIVRNVYDIRIDDAALRGAVEMGPEEAGAEFARLRAEYRVRREFATCTIDVSGLSVGATGILRALGFTIT